jgi:hypothetical protein
MGADKHQGYSGFLSGLLRFPCQTSRKTAIVSCPYDVSIPQQTKTP